MQEALAHARGRMTLRTTKCQAQGEDAGFAGFLNVTADTVRSWEKNRRQPSGPALRLLQVAQKRPEVLLESA